MKLPPGWQLPTVEFGRYFLASLIALGADVVVLLGLARVVHYLVAATAGFVVGAVLSYLLATRWVFSARKMSGRAHTEFAIYAVVGVIGLGINNLLIYVAVDMLTLPLFIGKVMAAGATFVFNFALRKWVLF